jgi:hypothetical protein
LKEFYSQLDDLIRKNEQGTIVISDDIEFSMHNTVRQITRYICPARELEMLDEAIKTFLINSHSKAAIPHMAMSSVAMAKSRAPE